MLPFVRNLSPTRNPSASSSSFDEVSKLVEIVRSKTRYHQPTLGLVCGSGLAKIADMLTDKEFVPFGDLPGFPVATVAGHCNRLVFGVLEGKTVICMQGRAHPYEGYGMSKCTLAVRMMKLLGVKTLILTNSCGGLNRALKTGDIVILKDHIFLAGLAGMSPLVGPNEEKFGPRFFSMANAYSWKLRVLAMETANEIGCTLHEGVYAMVGGPQYETAVECRLLQVLGADVVGMSTAHETTVARHCGLDVLGVSLVTNMCELTGEGQAVGAVEGQSVHEDVLTVGNRFADNIGKLLRAIIKKLPKEK